MPQNEPKTPRDKKPVSLRSVFMPVAIILGMGVLSLSGPSKKQNAATPPDATAEITVTPPAPVTFSDNVIAAKNKLSETKLGADIVNYVEQHKTTFAEDTSLVRRLNAAAAYTLGTNTISFADGSIPMLFRATVLAHEIRHLWQDNELGFGNMMNAAMTAEQQWVMNRFIEADAYAFASYYLANRMVELGQDSLATANQGVGIDDLSYALVIKKAMDNGTFDLNFYRENVLLPCFAQLQGTYNREHPERMTAALKKINLNADFAEIALVSGDTVMLNGAVARLDKAFKNAPTDAQFEKFLRRFGGLSLDPAAPTCLSDSNVTRDDLFSYADMQNNLGEAVHLKTRVLPQKTAEGDSILAELKPRYEQIKKDRDTFYRKTGGRNGY